MLINAPSTDSYDARKLAFQVDKALMEWGISTTDIMVRKVLPPSYIATQFLTQSGSIYGQASNSMLKSFFRPSNRDSQFKNLYYVGGTVHPGGGSPVVVKSGYEVAKRLLSV